MHWNMMTIFKFLVLNLRGGTNADMAPQIDEFTEVFLPNLRHFGPNIEFEVISSNAILRYLALLFQDFIKIFFDFQVYYQSITFEN